MTRDNSSGLLTPHSLSRRATLALFALISFMVFCFGGAFILFTAHRLDIRLAEQTKNLAELAETSLASAVWQVDHASARDFIEAVFRDKNVAFAEVVTGQELMASKARPKYIGQKFDYFQNNPKFLTESVEIKKDGDWIGTFKLAMDTDVNNEEIWIYAGSVLGLSPFFIASIFAAFFRYAKKAFFAPLMELEHSAIAIAEGDLDAYIDTSAPNELGNLARAIDDMRDSVRLLIGDLEEANTKLQNHKAMLESTVKTRTEELKQKNMSLNHALEEVRSAQQQAEKANLAKSSFLSSMSHEIRTPMNAILGMGDILIDTELSDDQRQYVEVFRSAGESLLEILDDILDLSKIEAGHLELEEEWFSLGETVEKTLNIIQTKGVSDEIALSCDFGPAIPDRLKGDSLRLRQVLINLLGNAVKFTEKGSVSLSITRTEWTEGNITLQFSVADTGMGIPGDKLATVFEAFTQADSSTTRRYGGTGLGLAISKRLVHLMHGRIWAESLPGRGSVFLFTATFGTEGEIPQITPSDEEQSFSPDLCDCNILMMEDSRYNAFVIETYLKDTPCRLTIKPDGESGVSAYRKSRWDLVLMDIQMPGMDGFQATSSIRRWEEENGLPRVPVVAMTAYAQSDDAQRCIDAGADMHIAKPVKKSVLLETIQSLVSAPLVSEDS